MEASERERLNEITVLPDQWNELERIVRLMPLNESQRHGVEHAFTHRLGLVQGPPGTGKTFFTEVLLRCFNCFASSDSKTLLAAPSKVGVDNAAQRLIHDEHKLADVVASKSPSGKSFWLRRYGRKLSLQYENVLRCIHLDSMCNRMGDFDKEKYAEEVAKASVLCGTQGSLPFGKVIPNQGCENGVAEENGLAFEVETLGALNLLRKRCTLVGDHNQQKQPLKSLCLRGTDFNRSLLERCAGKAGFEIVTLAANYRSHPRVLHFSSITWYGGKMFAACPRRKVSTDSWYFLAGARLPANCLHSC
jgi:hypothetical protein